MLGEQFLRTFECRLRHRQFRLRNLDLRLRIGVVVAKLSQSRNIKNHPVAANLLLMRRWGQRRCLYTAPLLCLGVELDQRLVALA